MKNSEEVLQELEKVKSKYRTILQAGISKWVKDFQDGKIKISTIDDLRKLIEIDIEILKDDYMLSKNNKPKGGDRGVRKKRVASESASDKGKEAFDQGRN